MATIAPIHPGEEPECRSPRPTAAASDPPAPYDHLVMTNTPQRPLRERLSTAGVPDALDPIEAWRRLRQAEGPRATVIDLYALVGEQRGLQPHELPRAERLELARSVMPDVWPGFTQTPGSERPNEPIQILEYDAEWTVRYRSWRQVIAEHLGDAARRIEHVGSTSVPGLPAKPIIDVQVSVESLADEARYVPALESAGLQLRSRDDLHRYFRPGPDRPRDVHVHVCEVGSQWEREHLLFRDHLRAHPNARERYAAAKREAAAVWGDDRYAYTDAKGALILELLAEASAEQ